MARIVNDGPLHHTGDSGMPVEPRYKSINRVITALLSYPEEFVAHVADLLERHLEPHGPAQPAPESTKITLKRRSRTNAAHASRKTADDDSPSLSSANRRNIDSYRR